VKWQELVGKSYISLGKRPGKENRTRGGAKIEKGGWRSSLLFHPDDGGMFH
jgi:hypothetical protein